MANPEGDKGQKLNTPVSRYDLLHKGPKFVIAAGLLVAAGKAYGEPWWKKVTEVQGGVPTIPEQIISEQIGQATFNIYKKEGSSQTRKATVSFLPPINIDVKVSATSVSMKPLGDNVSSVTMNFQPAEDVQAIKTDKQVVPATNTQEASSVAKDSLQQGKEVTLIQQNKPVTGIQVEASHDPTPVANVDVQSNQNTITAFNVTVGLSEHPEGVFFVVSQNA